MLARDVMTRAPFIVTAGEPISRAAELMRDLDLGMLPVVDDADNLFVMGVLTDRDITVRCVAPGHDAGCTVGDHMTSGRIATVMEDEDVERAIALMERVQVRRIPVVDSANCLVGIIAQADIARKLGDVEPLRIEHALERISAPGHVLVS